MSKIDSNRIHCKEHPDALLAEDRRAGDQICTVCGLVVGDRTIDVVCEWRTFSNENTNAKPSRVGGPENPLLKGPNLSSMIRGSRGDAAFDEFGVAKYQNRQLIRSADRRGLRGAINDMNQMADRLNLPKTIVDRANNLFKTVHDGKVIQGRSNKSIASACLYIAGRQEGVPRTLKEISAVSTISKIQLTDCFTKIRNALNLSVDLISTDDFISRFCSNLGLPNVVQRAAAEIARTAVVLDIVPGRSPISVAGAAIYMASQASELKRSKKDIADATGVGDITIRKSYRLMYPRAEQLFPKGFKFHTQIDELPLA